jgi:hypothetical protein
MDQLITNIITNLPNFAGLMLALIVVMRNNDRLTKALIDMAKNCSDAEYETEKTSE